MIEGNPLQASPIQPDRKNHNRPLLETVEGKRAFLDALENARDPEQIRALFGNMSPDKLEHYSALLAQLFVGLKGVSEGIIDESLPPNNN